MTQITFPIKELLQAYTEGRVPELVWGRVAMIYREQVTQKLVDEVYRVVTGRLAEPKEQRPDWAQKLVVHVTPPIPAKVGGSEWTQEVKV